MTKQLREIEIFRNRQLKENVWECLNCGQEYGEEHEAEECSVNDENEDGE